MIMHDYDAYLLFLFPTEFIARFMSWYKGLVIKDLVVWAYKKSKEAKWWGLSSPEQFLQVHKQQFVVCVFE